MSFGTRHMFFFAFAAGPHLFSDFCALAQWEVHNFQHDYNPFLMDFKYTNIILTWGPKVCKCYLY